MANIFSFYPTIDEQLQAKLGLHHKGLKMSYMVGFDEFQLENETDDSTGYIYTISDKRNIWDPENCDLTISKEYIISNPEFLFGENGVCPFSGIIGLAILWSCKGTNSRGIIPVGEITNQTSKNTIYNFEHTFAKGTLRNTLDIELIAYLKKKGVSNSNNFYSTVEGVTFGTLDSNRMIIDGNASVFPIVIVEEPSQPLWWVTLDYADPTEDAFSAEFISVRINKSHKNFKKLESEDGVKGNPLLVEIMASSVQIIVDALKNSGHWNNINEKNQLEQGSIGEAVHYILQTYELMNLTEELFARQLRMKLEER